MPGVERITFGLDTWSKGNRADMLPHASDKPYLENCHLWPNGLLGQRPWYEDNSVTLSSLITQNSRIVGAQYNYGYTGGQGENGLLAISPTEIEFYRTADNYASVYANNTNGVTGVTKDSWVTRVDTYRYVVMGGLIECQGPAPATPKTIQLTSIRQAVNTRFGGGASIQTVGSTVHQGRTFIWGGMLSGTTVSATNRIYYSDPYDYAVFTSASQYFDVDGEVQGCLPLGPNLVIWTSEARWYVLQGRGDPATATLNFLGTQPIPAFGIQPAYRSGMALFVTSDDSAICSLSSNGIVKVVQPLGSAGSVYASTTALQPISSDLFNITHLPTSKTESYVEFQGVWYQEKQDGAYYDDHQRAIIPNTGATFMCEWNTSTSRWDVYERDCFSNNIVENDGASGAFASGWKETSPADIGLPRISMPEYSVRVRRVIIDARTYSEAAGQDYPPPEADIEVDDGENNTITLTVGPGTGFAVSSSTLAEKHRFVCTAGPAPFTAHSDVWIRNMKGLAIESVTVEFEVSPGQIV